MSLYGDYPLPAHLDHLRRQLATEYDDINATGACGLVLINDHDDPDGRRSLTLHFTEMRHLAIHLLNLAEEAEHDFLKARNALE